LRDVSWVSWQRDLILRTWSDPVAVRSVGGSCPSSMRTRPTGRSARRDASRSTSVVGSMVATGSAARWRTRIWTPGDRRPRSERMTVRESPRGA